MKGTVVERFWAKVDRRGPDECWPWTGATQQTGYGRFRVDGRLQGAHRVAYVLTHGHLRPGAHVLHRCDTPGCCNPSHLFLGTHADNMADKEAKGRGDKSGLCRGRPW